MQSGNRVFYSTFGISRENAYGTAVRDLGDDDWKASGLWAALAATVLPPEGGRLGTACC